MPFPTIIEAGGQEGRCDHAVRERFVSNALRLPCVADELRTVASEAELAERLADADARGKPVTLLGGGTNLVLRPRLQGLVVYPRLRGLTVRRLDNRCWRVDAGAGETWQEVVRATLGQGIGGLENLALIPGTVGAAPIQNIGAYGRELAEVIDSVKVFDRRDRTFKTLAAEECRFRYRDSLFKSGDSDRYVIVRVCMVLGSLPVAVDYPAIGQELARMGETRSKEIAPKPQAVAEAVVRVRRRKLPDPRHIGNVGSFFKNPELTAAQLDDVRARLDIDAHASGEKFKISAARLIDSAGWKGVRRGAVQAWPRQPLVLVNHGGASCDDVLDFANRIRDDVASKYGVRLAMEPAVKGMP